MANQINTRIALKYDSYSAWEAVKDTFKPLKGEVCIVNPATNLSDATSVPCLMKVGDGEHFWKDLPWVGATAADVYNWAKKPEAEFIAWVNSVVVHPDLTPYLVETDITTGVPNGTIKVRDTEVKVAGLKSAAYTASTDYATSAQGDTADSALQSVSVLGKVLTKEDNVISVEDAKTELGLQDAAYATVASLNATAKGYADAVEAKLPTSADYGVLTVSGKEAIKVTEGQNPEVSIALDNSGNVVLSQSNTGLKAAIDLSEYRKIVDDEDTKYHLEYDSTDKAIKLVEGTGTMSIDAKPFIKDGMLENVTYAAETNTLTFTFNTDAGKQNITVELSDIIDALEGVDGTTVTVTANGNKISAEVKTDSINTDHIKMGAINGSKIAGKAISKTHLNDDLAAAIDKANSALQEHQDISGKKNVQTAVTKEGSTVKTITKITQNENGDITEVKFEDIAFPGQLGASGSVATAVHTNGTGKVTLAGGVALSKDAEGYKLTKTGSDVELEKIASTGSIYDVVEGFEVSGANGEDVEDMGARYLIFNCGTSTTVI